MPDSTASIAKLESAYSRLIFETLPVLSSKRRPTIEGQLVVLSATRQEGAHWRMLHPPPPPGNEAEKQRLMVCDILQGVVQDLMDSAVEAPGVAMVRDAMVGFRTALDAEGIDPSALTWALPSVQQPIHSTVMHRRLLAEIERGRGATGWHVVSGYVDLALSNAPNPEELFKPLVVEMLICTRELSIAEITEDRLRSIHLRALPFCALGVLRGLAMWFLLDADEVHQTKGLRAEDVVQTLGATFSTSVIDVFTAYFMSNVGELTTLADAGKSGTIISEALDYLYPNNGFRLIPEDAGTHMGSDPEAITLRLRHPDVRRFLRFSGATWRLCYERPARRDFYHPTPPDDAYHRLIEVKLQDIAIKAASEMDRQYGRLLGVFGHHSGSLFKASGVFQVWSRCNRGESPDRREVKKTLDKLLPVWGISQAISLIQKVDNESGLTVPPTWLDEQWLERQDIGDAASIAINRLVRYVFDNATDEPPALPWIITSHHNTVQNLRWSEDPEQRNSQLASLPPFDDDPIIFDKTLAITIGLYEMLNNLRKYPPARGWGRSVRKALKKLPHYEQLVAVEIEELPGEIRVAVEQPVMLGGDGELPHSRSLERIRIFEYQCLRGLVATGDKEQTGTTSNPRIVRVRQEWSFRWGELIRVLRREHGKTA